MSKKKNFTSDVVKCTHCTNASRFLILGSVFNSQPNDYHEDFPDTERGNVYEILECENCNKEVIRKYFWVDGWEDDDNRSIEFNYLYPSPEKKRAYALPPEVRKGLDSANAVKNIDANAYGVLLRRLLEQVCINQNAKGDSLHDKLKDLANKKIIPDTLINVAHGLRNLGNVGAHAGVGELTINETELMTSLCDAIVEYVYYAPDLVNQAQMRLDKIKQK